jgi:hypothetical protein
LRKEVKSRPLHNTKLKHFSANDIADNQWLQSYASLKNRRFLNYAAVSDMPLLKRTKIFSADF